MDGDFHCLDEMLQKLRVWNWGKFGGALNALTPNKFLILLFKLQKQ